MLLLDWCCEGRSSSLELRSAKSRTISTDRSRNRADKLSRLAVTFYAAGKGGYGSCGTKLYDGQGIYFAAMSVYDLVSCECVPFLTSTLSAANLGRTLAIAEKALYVHRWARRVQHRSVTRVSRCKARKILRKRLLLSCLIVVQRESSSYFLNHSSRSY